LVNKTYPVRWDNKAKDSLREIIAYLKQDSPTAAQKVKQTFLQLTASLKQQPERFPAEPYLTVKVGDYRSVHK
jgi:plasmid stabilization system protein ParE